MSISDGWKRGSAEVWRESAVKRCSISSRVLQFRCRSIGRVRADGLASKKPICSRTDDAENRDRRHEMSIRTDSVMNITPSRLRQCLSTFTSSVSVSIFSSSAAGGGGPRGLEPKAPRMLLSQCLGSVCAFSSALVVPWPRREFRRVCGSDSGNKAHRDRNHVRHRVIDLEPEVCRSRTLLECLLSGFLQLIHAIRVRTRRRGVFSESDRRRNVLADCAAEMQRFAFVVR